MPRQDEVKDQSDHMKDLYFCLQQQIDIVLNHRGLTLSINHLHGRVIAATLSYREICL